MTIIFIRNLFSILKHVNLDPCSKNYHKTGEFMLLLLLLQMKARGLTIVIQMMLLTVKMLGHALVITILSIGWKILIVVILQKVLKNNS